MEWKQFFLKEFYHFYLEKTHLEVFEFFYLYSVVAFLYLIVLQAVVLMESPFVGVLELATHLHFLEF